MSLARAFTTKRTKPTSASGGTPQRSMTTKGISSLGAIRHKISAPLELVSTTNMLSYNAPDIYPSAGSGDESDSVPSLTHSPGGSTHGGSSIDLKSSTPEPNHLSCYFEKSADRAARLSGSSNEDAPSIPKRALSHTKRTHEALHRKRSMSRLSGGRTSPTTFKTSSIAVVRDSVQMFSAQADPLSEPFGKELAQVNELAEEFGAAVHIVSDEERQMAALGLYKFSAHDYMCEIEPLYLRAYVDGQSKASWI